MFIILGIAYRDGELLFIILSTLSLLATGRVKRVLEETRWISMASRTKRPKPGPAVVAYVAVATQRRVCLPASTCERKRE